MKSKTTSRHFRRAFTLIELLVVVSIIALLVAILLPVLKKAREQGKQAVCLANLKGIVTAGITYAYSDAQEMVIPVHPLFETDPTGSGYYDWGGKSGKGEPSVDGVPATSRWGTGEGRGPGTRPLNYFLIKGKISDHRDDPGPNQINWTTDADMDIPILRCPSDRGFTGFHLKTLRDSGLSSFEHFGNSYSSNSLWFGTWYSQSTATIGTVGPYLRALSGIPAPARSLLYMENCARLSWYLTRMGFSSCHLNIANDGVVLSPKRIQAWHGADYRFVTGFSDGHAGATSIRGQFVPPPRLSTYPELDSFSSMEAAYIRYRCGIIRGKGWQLDCLPAPEIKSQIASPLPPPTGFIG